MADRPTRRKRELAAPRYHAQPSLAKVLHGRQARACVAIQFSR